MNYFKDCKTLDQAKKLFRSLSLKLHPDKGGKAKEFIEMRRQFKAFKPSVKSKHDKNFDFNKFEDIVYKFEGLTNIEVEFVGTFIWLKDAVNGATYEQKDKIKAIVIDGYNKARFASKKKRWYFSPQGYKKTSRKRLSMEQVKGLYGCETYKNSRLQLN